MANVGDSLRRLCSLQHRYITCLIVARVQGRYGRRAGVSASRVLADGRLQRRRAAVRLSLARQRRRRVVFVARRPVPLQERHGRQALRSLRHPPLRPLRHRLHAYAHSLAFPLFKTVISAFPFLQILPTIAYHFFSWTDATDSPDCLPILLSISVFSLYSSCSPLLVVSAL